MGCHLCSRKPPLSHAATHTRHPSHPAQTTLYIGNCTTRNAHPALVWTKPKRSAQRVLHHESWPGRDDALPKMEISNGSCTFTFWPSIDLSCQLSFNRRRITTCHSITVEIPVISSAFLFCLDKKLLNILYWVRMVLSETMTCLIFLLSIVLNSCSYRNGAKTWRHTVYSPNFCKPKLYERSSSAFSCLVWCGLNIWLQFKAWLFQHKPTNLTPVKRCVQYVIGCVLSSADWRKQPTAPWFLKLLLMFCEDKTAPNMLLHLETPNYTIPLTGCLSSATIIKG